MSYSITIYYEINGERQTPHVVNGDHQREVENKAVSWATSNFNNVIVGVEYHKDGRMLKFDAS